MKSFLMEGFSEIMLDKREKVSYHGDRGYFVHISVLTVVGHV